MEGVQIEDRNTGRKGVDGKEKDTTKSSLRKKDVNLSATLDSVRIVWQQISAGSLQGSRKEPGLRK